MLDYGSVMRSTVITTTEILEQIEQDLLESRLLIRARNTDDDIAAQLVASLQEDNALLMVRITLHYAFSLLHIWFLPLSPQLCRRALRPWKQTWLICTNILLSRMKPYLKSLKRKYLRAMERLNE